MTTYYEKLPELKNIVANQHEDAVARLQELVEIETPSNDVPSLEKMADYLVRWARTALGNLERLTVHKHEGYGPTVVFDVPGDIEGRVVVVGHFDTVWPLGTIDEIPFSRDNGIIKGPGTLDMKAGLVTGIHAVQLMKKQGIALPTITFIFNGDEELGSIASRPIIEAEAEGALAGFVIEPGVDWDLKTERKGIGIFDLEITGIESHAGNDPLGGASAIQALAELIPQIHAGANLEAGTSVNVGVVSGGTGSNVLAGKATAEIDVRITNFEEAKRIDHLFEDLSVSDERIKFKITGNWNRPPMPLSEEGAKLFRHAQTIASHLRTEELGGRSVGGGSDGNFMAAKGLPVLDGLGVSGNGPHARSEHVLEGDMDDRILLFAGILATAFITEL